VFDDEISPVHQLAVPIQPLQRHVRAVRPAKRESNERDTITKTQSQEQDDPYAVSFFQRVIYPRILAIAVLSSWCDL
jgi:hypothetical protein